MNTLFIRFPDQSPSFVHGYEAGIIGAKMELGLDFEMNIHQENKDLIKDMANKYGYNFAIQDYKGFEEWAFMVVFKKKSTDN